MNNKPEMYTRERLRAKGRFSAVQHLRTHQCLSPFRVHKDVLRVRSFAHVKDSPNGL